MLRRRLRPATLTARGRMRDSPGAKFGETAAALFPVPSASPLRPSRDAAGSPGSYLPRARDGVSARRGRERGCSCAAAGPGRSGSGSGSSSPGRRQSGGSRQAVLVRRAGPRPAAPRPLARPSAPRPRVPPAAPPLPHSHTLTHTHTHTHTAPFTHTTASLRHTHSIAHTHRIAHTHIGPLTHPMAHKLTYTRSHTCSARTTRTSHRYRHTHTLKHPRALSRSRTEARGVSLTHSHHAPPRTRAHRTPPFAGLTLRTRRVLPLRHTGSLR
ncbi:protein FAM27D1-like [Cinclus cinclus]|uniref:protein FAM27D1-like n=1 Tax=Cinclus cinclus TaxID=127875 RepID=UPI002E0D370B